MNRLVRLYPAAWRERYGDEFSALLEDVRPSPFDVIDILLAALDAHLRPQPPAAAAHPRKGKLMTPKHYGYAAIVGGSLLLGMQLSGAVLPIAIREVVAYVVYPFAAVSLLLALAGMSALAARRGSGRAWLAFLLPAGGLFISLAGMVLTALLPDRPLLAGLAPYHIAMVGLLAFLFGSVIFILDGLQFGSIPRAPAVTLGIGALGGIVGGVAMFSPWTPTPHLLVVSAWYGGILLYCLGWIWLGHSSVRRGTLVTPVAG